MIIAMRSVTLWNGGQRTFSPWWPVPRSFHCAGECREQYAAMARADRGGGTERTTRQRVFVLGGVFPRAERGGTGGHGRRPRTNGRLRCLGPAAHFQRQT